MITINLRDEKAIGAFIRGQQEIKRERLEKQLKSCSLCGFKADLLHFPICGMDYDDKYTVVCSNFLCRRNEAKETFEKPEDAVKAWNEGNMRE